jgi:hypothetical protein
MNEPMGRRGSLSPARERRIALATLSSASSCPITRCRSRSSICDQLLHFAFQHLRHRNAGPLADDLGDIFLVNFFLQHARLLAVHRRAQLASLAQAAEARRT